MAARGKLFAIPPGAPFLDALAAGLIARGGSRPDALSPATILLPTRRACRALADSFLAQSGGAALLLPSIDPIGDIDADALAAGAEEEPRLADALDIPPAVPELRRQLLLARLIGRTAGAGAGPPTPAQAAQLAFELARLVDRVQTERLSFDRLAGLAPDRYAAHWQQTLAFLRIVTEHWPRVLAELGCIDPADRRNRLVAAQIALWRRRPPAGPVVVAGSTGSVPATADLIEAVAGLPDGLIVLPGLDRSLDEADCAAIGPTHPQAAMARLLARLGARPAEVAIWPGAAPSPRAAARSALLGEAMRPRAAPPRPARAPDAALDGLRRIDCPGPQEEAGVIALALRQCLEIPGKTAALVTADRGLARRVAAELRRWEVEIDDSGGRRLADTPPGVFLRLIAALVAENAAPAALLAAFKHPLAAGGGPPAPFRARVRELERAALRGPRPAPGLEGLRYAVSLSGAAGTLGDWLSELQARIAPFESLMGRGRPIPVAELLAANVGLAETLAATDRQTGPDRLWSGEAGEAAAGFVADLDACAAALEAIDGAAWPALLEALMGARVVRPRYGRHPRVNVWGPLEARLQHADLIVLGGLNEGSWPPDAGVDPWMSRPMREAFGLPPPERRVGLAAHDFAQAFAADEVMLTRAVRAGGAPTVASRWLLRLDNALEAAGRGGAPAAEAAGWLAWQSGLDRPPPGPPPAPPRPAPPVEARPRKLSVTQIETLMRDPYAVYARHVLRLAPLDALDADPTAADRGNVVHRALDEFLKACPDELPDDALARLLEAGERAFGHDLSRPGVRAFWWPRFERVAAWLLDYERSRRPGLVRSHGEVRGQLEIAAPAGPFTLTARADRIDRLAAGGLAVIDYKTGRPPPMREIESGFAPQLPLEAAIAAAGGFAGVPPAEVAELAFWRLSGGEPPGEVVSAGRDVGALAAAALAGVAALIAAYDDPGAPYLPRPDPDRAPRFSHYDHLARLGEWAGRGGGPAS